MQAIWAFRGIYRVTNGEPNSPMQQVLRYWQILLAAAAVIVAFSSVQTQANTNTTRLDKLEQTVPAIDNRLIRMETQLVDLQATSNSHHADISAALNRLDDKISEKGRLR